jgi:hypothetical protein
MIDFLEFLRSISGLLGSGAIAIALAAWVRARPDMKRAEVEEMKVELEGEAALWKRIEALEKEVVALRKAMDFERATHAAEIADLQHDLHNESFSFDAFILLAEANPDKAIEQVPTIKENRREHKERMALKRGAREGAAIAAADGEGQ